MAVEDLDAELAVYFGETFAGFADAHHGVADEELCGGHEEGGGHAVAGDVADCHDQTAVGEFEPIVKITADMAGGAVDGGDIDSADFGELIGEPGELNFSGLAQLFGEEIVFEAFEAEAATDELPGGGDQQGGDTDDNDSAPEEGRG